MYDEWYDDVSDAAATAAFIDGFGTNQRVVELGVGTGRLAAAIRSRGHEVIGVDSSRAMLDRLDRNVAGDATESSMDALPVRGGCADIVLVATNTLFNLTDTAAQSAVFTEARRVLRLGGRFVVEADRPATTGSPRDPVGVRSVEFDRVVLTATQRDGDVITGQHIEITDGSIRLRPWRIRMVDVDGLDQMADAAGLRLGDRFSGWNRTPFSPDDPHAVSVWVAV